MKKVILCLAVIFMAVSIEVNAQTKYTPSPTSKISKEWFVNNFIMKNKLDIHYDFYKTNDYTGPTSCIVLSKKKSDSAMAIFDYAGQSYIAKHKLFDGKNNISYYGNVKYPSIFNDSDKFSLEDIKTILGAKEVLPLTHKNLLIALKEL